MKYDDKRIKPTKELISAIEYVGMATIEMMRKRKDMHPECWTWCVCTIEDFACSNGISYTFGGDEDKPKGFPKRKKVWVQGI